MHCFLQEDLKPEPVASTGADINSMQDIQIVEVVPTEEWGTMPLQKMRTLLALLLKKISTPSRLKKLGFGTRLIEDVKDAHLAAAFGWSLYTISFGFSSSIIST